MHYTSVFSERKEFFENLSSSNAHFCGLSNILPEVFLGFCIIFTLEHISLKEHFN